MRDGKTRAQHRAVAVIKDKQCVGRAIAQQPRHAAA